MQTHSFRSTLRRARRDLAAGPVALVLAADSYRLADTVRHLAEGGFASILVLGDTPYDLEGARAGDAALFQVPYNVHAPGAFQTAVNGLIAALPGVWIHACWNGEFFLWPHHPLRNARELTRFLQDERRPVVAGVMVDLYGEAPGDAPSGAPLWFDGQGYTGPTAEADKEPDAPRIYGGLRLRHSGTLSACGDLAIDRPVLFRARKGLMLGADYRFNIDVYNTRACPWHRSVTGVVASLRATRALADRLSDPGHPLCWPASVAYDGTAAQFLSLGFMEPGQWA